MEMETVLLLNGETIQALSIAKQLRQSGYCVGVVCDTKESYGYYNKNVDWKILAPSIHDRQKEFHIFFTDYVKRNHIDVVIPMNDFSAEYLSKYKNELIRFTNFIIPDYDVFLDGYDKNRLMKICEREEFPHPKTIDLSAVPLEIAASEMVYPALIKPNITTGGRGFAKVNNADELKSKYPQIFREYGDCHVQEFIPSGGMQFKVELFRDKNGCISHATVMHKARFYPENGGSSCCSVSIKNDKLANLCSSVLHKLNWLGFADFDLIEDPRTGNINIMEINPRVPACIRLSIVSGVDFATIIADASIGKSLKEYVYTPGKILRYMALDILWFKYSANRFKTTPSWFNFFGKNVYWQECGGGIYAMMKGTMAGLVKQLNPKFRESKAGLR